MVVGEEAERTLSPWEAAADACRQLEVHSRVREGSLAFGAPAVCPVPRGCFALRPEWQQRRGLLLAPLCSPGRRGQPVRGCFESQWERSL